MKSRFSVRVIFVIVFIWVGLGAWIVDVRAEESTIDTLRFVAGGGLLLQGMLLNTAELESALSATFEGDYSLGDQAVFSSVGGLGFAGEFTRIGGLSVSARWAGTVYQGPFESVYLSLSYEGVFLEQTVLKHDLADFVIGGLVGGGRWRVDLLEQRSGSFETIMARPSGVSLSRNFLALQPYIGVEKRAFGVLGVKLLAGLLGAFSYEDWKLPENTPISGGPLSLSLIPTLTVIFILGV